MPAPLADDSLIGTDVDNLYLGGSGSDTLADSSPTSSDTYVWGRGDDADLVSDSGGNDRVMLRGDVDAEQIWLRELGNDLEVSIIGTPDKMVIENWYGDEDHQLERFVTTDGRTLLAGDVQNLVDAMASFAPPAQGETMLPDNYRASLAPVMAANWH